ncbi:TPA: hypothetical protein ACUNF5_003702 [Burkholderia orbicola]|uniref:hypothetical protein n=1 Tax=Burkholderia cenocepacia TaxID=95486 RepID=UPI000981B65C|nr:hypothetical protein [Burkholderia cenocepacia]AQQ34748.1 hypothetical protein A8E96_21355 [Burkholderia cenocepacia]MBN3566799.1 hypothetical protein [Burkholderia cenocepacia]MBR8075881.1 hypothetical protein [Burkholderia cenocepacia]MBR8110261.1 hypothetical protein [Burkholderia cenocepacia]ONW34040.1 hypothetical protein A8E95_12655 [Burkholderia cenocepacia]
MAFNTDMPVPEFTFMSLDPAADYVAESPCDVAGANACAVAADTRAPKRRAERTDGRSRRFRFGDALEDAPPRVVTGSIAISFAVVSRRNWPR